MSSINRTRPDLWKADALTSVQMYNEWFMAAAPLSFRSSRQTAIDDVNALFESTDSLLALTPQGLYANPSILATLRMVTAPPLARDRLAGLAGVSTSFVKSLEAGKLPARRKKESVVQDLKRLLEVITEMVDESLIDWLESHESPQEDKTELASLVIADRRCGALADPIIRNAQEERQVSKVSAWLDARDYTMRKHEDVEHPQSMAPGTYAIHQNVPAIKENGTRVNMPIDIVIQPKSAEIPNMPILIEAKSAGDFANTNKRRKEEATKAHQLQACYGSDVSLILLLCGYFDAQYLGYEAAEGLDWVWEHRLEDLENAGI